MEITIKNSSRKNIGRNHHFIMQTTSDIYAHVTKEINTEATHVLSNVLYAKKQGKVKGKYRYGIPQILAITCCEISHKPSSVLSNHLSRPTVASKLKRRTQRRDGQPL